MICLRITDDLQQMNWPFEHRACRELWENVAKTNAAAHLRWIPFPACAVTVCSFTMQGAQELTLDFYSFSEWQRKICMQNCYHISLIYQRVCMRETNKLLVTWRKQGMKKSELALFIALATGATTLQTAISGSWMKHNQSNCVVWRKWNTTKHIKQ